MSFNGIFVLFPVVDRAQREGLDHASLTCLLPM